MLIEGFYNYNIVLISIMVAILATFSSLHIIEKMSDEKDKGKYFWLFSGSFVMGGGMWASHYIGMLAFEVPVETTHNITLTILSVLVSMGSLFIAFMFIMIKVVSPSRFILSGIFVGTGISAMHYIGMSAVDIPADVEYAMPLVILSMLISYGGSYITLGIFLTFRHRTFSLLLKWVAAIFMGVTIYLSHYVGIKATKFYAYEEAIIASKELDTFILYSIIVIVAFMLLNSWAVMLFDHHVLKRMAYRDPLTGLSNRNEMKQYFKQLKNQKNICAIFRFRSV